ALQKTAAAVGADVRKVDQTYYLGSTTELRAMVSKTGVKQSVALKYVEPAEIQTELQHTFPYLTVEAIAKTKILMLVGDADEVQAAVRIAAQRDIAPPAVPVAVVAKPVLVKDTYSVKYAKPEALAETLGKVLPDVKVSCL